MQQQHYTPITENDDEDELRRIDAMISHYLHIPHPESLDEELYWEKAAQAKWIAQKLNKG